MSCSSFNLSGKDITVWLKSFSLNDLRNEVILFGKNSFSVSDFVITFSLFLFLRGDAFFLKLKELSTILYFINLRLIVSLFKLKWIDNSFNVYPN